MQAPGIIFPALVTCSRDTQAITVWDLGNAGPEIAPVRTIRESIGDGKSSYAFTKSQNPYMQPLQPAGGHRMQRSPQGRGHR